MDETMDDTPASTPTLACPVDGTGLEEARLGDVALHYCPECQGIWLTRPEFEQLIEQATRDARRDETPAEASETSGAHADDETPHPSRGLRAFLDDLFG